jgi:hypothetical protein
VIRFVWLLRVFVIMKIELRVDMLDPELLHPVSKKPEGVSVGPLQSEIFNGPPPDHQALYVIITIVGSVPAQVLANWIYDHFKQYKPKRIRINRKEIKLEKGEIVSVVTEKYEETQGGDIKPTNNLKRK